MQKKYNIKITSPNLRSLLFFEKRIKRFKLLKLVYLPRNRKRFVLQKSPFVQSKAKEHFQILFHKRLYILQLHFNELKSLLLTVPWDIVVRIEQDF